MLEGAEKETVYRTNFKNFVNPLYKSNEVCYNIMEYVFFLEVYHDHLRFTYPYEILL